MAQTNLEIATEQALTEMGREDDMGYPHYEYAGAFAIMNVTTGEGAAQYHDIRRGQCCGIVEQTLNVGGEEFLYTFDYGH